MNVSATTNNTSTTSSQLSTSSNGSTSSSSITSGTDALANEQTFLKLFVAQLQNQDPENPADGTQFVTQLAQFSQLEQSLQAREDLDSINQNVQTAVTDLGAGSTSSTSSGSGTTDGSQTTTGS